MKCIEYNKDDIAKDVCRSIGCNRANDQFLSLLSLSSPRQSALTAGSLTAVRGRIVPRMHPLLTTAREARVDVTITTGLDLLFYAFFRKFFLIFES